MQATHFFLKCLLLSIVLIKCSESIKILLVSPITSPSHLGPQLELATALAKRDHDVTIISAHQQKKPIKNLRCLTVSIPTVINSVDDDLSLFEFLRLPTTHYFDMLTDLATNSTEALFNNANVQELLSDPKEKFDIVILEQFLTYALQGFCHHFDAHCIIYTSLRYNTFIKPLVGYMTPLSYIADPIMGYDKDLSFCERLNNIFIYLYAQYRINYSVLPRQNELLKRYIKGAPDINDVIYNSSLVLQNSHISINYPAPEPPNVVEIGGFHINPEETGSKDIQDFLDSSPEGVIYFSFGSVLKSRQLSKDRINALTKAFSKLKVKVLWKFEDEHLKGKPDNVKIVNWAPQKYVLSHPNVKLFISHGGMFSTIEAVYFGKPVMGIPVYGDQISNMKYLVNIGVAKYLSFDNITEVGLLENLQEILKNPSFTERAQENSRLLHDQPMKPMDKAIYWIEFVHRHKGGSRMALAGLNLPVYKLVLLDVALLVFCIPTALIVLVFICIKLTRRMFRTKKIDCDLKKKKVN